MDTNDAQRIIERHKAAQSDPHKLLAAAACLLDSSLIQEALRLGADVNANHSPRKGRNAALALVCSPHAPSTKAPGRQAQLECVKILIDAGADLNLLQSTNGTPVALVSMLAGRGDAELCRMLLDAGASPNTEHSFGRGAGHLCVWGRSTECLSLLIERGLNIHRFDEEGYNLMIHAVLRKGADSLEILIDAGGRALEHGPFGWNALNMSKAHSDPSTHALVLARAEQEELDSPSLAHGESAQAPRL